MANSSINLVNLDFDTMKSSLKTYMKSQAAFKDYDFDGSNMSVLLDILSFNTFHNAFYLNMVVNEAFLDSAQMRNSVVSHAKELNYLPRSATSSKAKVDLTFGANTNVVTVPRGTSFTTTVESNLLTFITDDDYVAFSSNGTFSVTNVEIYEGRLTTDTFIMDYDNEAQRFVLADPGIDTSSMVVTVKEDDTTTTFTKATSSLGLGSTSKVYFMQGCEDSKYEMIFGDDIIGYRPKDGAVVTVSYRTTSGESGDGASKFFLDTEFTAFTTTPTVETVQQSIGGANKETLTSIKYNAPRSFQVQERAINANDYEIILTQEFPEIRSVSAYGGEDLNPPDYGRVYISVNISDVNGIPDSKSKEYRDFIAERSPMSIDTVIVEPDYTYFDVNTTVKYNKNGTSLSSEQVKSLVINAIIDYNDTTFNDFKSSFKYSKFVYMIDSIENSSILSNDTEIRVYKKVVPILGTAYDLNLTFDIPFTKKGSKLESTYSLDDLVTLTSSEFTYNGSTVRVEDDGEGTLRIVKTVGTSVSVVVPSIGTVDYDTGKVSLVNFRVDSLPTGENSIRFFAVTEYKDFSTKGNVILTIEPSILKVNVTAVSE